VGQVSKFTVSEIGKRTFDQRQEVEQELTLWKKESTKIDI